MFKTTKILEAYRLGAHISIDLRPRFFVEASNRSFSSRQSASDSAFYLDGTRNCLELLQMDAPTTTSGSRRFVGAYVRAAEGSVAFLIEIKCFSNEPEVVGEAAISGQFSLRGSVTFFQRSYSARVSLCWF